MLIPNNHMELICTANDRVSSQHVISTRCSSQHGFRADHMPGTSSYKRLLDVLSRKLMQLIVVWLLSNACVIHLVFVQLKLTCVVGLAM